MALEGRIDEQQVLDSRRFQVAIKRLADSLGYGSDRSLFLGSGIEYAQSRPYQFGDPVKSIDWKVTARTRKPYVKEYETPKRLCVHLVLDTSASMAVSSIPRSKYETAVFVAGGLALACLERMSPVGLLGAGGRPIRVQPSLSKDQVLRWLHLLRTYRFDEPTTLADRLTELGTSLTERVLIIVLSDLHEPEALVRLKRLGQRHDCVALRFQDPAEESQHLSGAGFLRAREAETGREFVTRGRDAFLEPKEADRQLKRAGIDHLTIRTDLPYAARLRQFLRARDLLGRGART
ncbi:DUF58 domain-containing protein [Isosphaera pallida]|uniref:DUF58 domain-containing protein n=1 Tax=Isosphaera pallida TaxID=128 RepID=UPI000301E476|nr:DUF58 domain-containing protein [Isosphaera pallida]